MLDFDSSVVLEFEVVDGLETVLLSWRGAVSELLAILAAAAWSCEVASDKSCGL